MLGRWLGHQNCVDDLYLDGAALHFVQLVEALICKALGACSPLLALGHWPYYQNYIGSSILADVGPQSVELALGGLVLVRFFLL